MIRSVCSILVVAVSFAVVGCGGNDTAAPITKDEMKPLDASSIEKLKGTGGTPKKKL